MLKENLKNFTIKSVDFNCDLAQSFGVFKNREEEDLACYASSVNIACGFHCGDPQAIKKAILLSKKENLTIGAHIGFDDIKGFGYRDMYIDDEQLETLVIYQVGALKSFADSFGCTLEHVRPHGAMYKRVYEDSLFAIKVAKAIAKVDSWLNFVMPFGENANIVEEESIVKVVKEFCPEFVYDKELNIDFGSKQNDFRAYESLKNYLKYGTINYKKIGQVQTIHFSSLNVIKNANEIIVPTCVSCTTLKNCGWGENSD